MHRGRKRFFTTMIVIVLLLPVAIPAAAGENTERSGEMQAFYETWHPGWNLGNTFDATGSETSWGNPPTTKDLMDYIAAAGFHSIRIPVTWGHRMGPGPDCLIQESFLDRIEEVVNWALDAGLTVMLNVHHDTGDTGWIMSMPRDAGVLPRFQALWEQIAARFRDYPLDLVFESLNEPRFSPDWNEDNPLYFDLLDILNQAFYTVVRNSGGNNTTRPLVMPTLTCSPSQARLNQLAETLAKLDDENLIATVHYYGYWPFSVNIAGTTKFDNQSKADITTTIRRLTNTFVSKGIPVIIGEYGLLGFDKAYNTIQRGEVLKYTAYLGDQARENLIPLMIWDNGQHLDRMELVWRDPALFATAMSSGPSANTDSDTLYFRGGYHPQDTQVKLNLNGNQLLHVYNQGKELTSPADYELRDSTLVLKEEFLADVLGPNLGVAATLELEFSAGANWGINLVVYQPPVLQEKQALTNYYYIPVKFNGTTLATMEAVYANGVNAGPQNWTSFKEFNYCFQPRYDLGIIELTPAFFNEVKDGQIRLKFHFHSGEIKEYMLTKSGMSISGVPVQ